MFSTPGCLFQPRPSELCLPPLSYFLSRHSSFTKRNFISSQHLIHRDSGISVPPCLLICKDRIGNSRSDPRSTGSMRGRRSWHQEGAHQRWLPTPLSQNHCWGAHPNRVPHQGPPAGPNIRLGPHCRAWAGPAHPGVHLSSGGWTPPVICQGEADTTPRYQGLPEGLDSPTPAHPEGEVSSSCQPPSSTLPEKCKPALPGQ